MPRVRRVGGRHALGLTAAAAILTGAVLVMLPPEDPPAPPPVSAQVGAPSPPGPYRSRPVSADPVLVRSEPRRLDIPKIGVHVSLGRLGLKPDGTVRIPPVEHPEWAGWYEKGASPGERGAAVILGHVDGGGRKGVFFDLGRMRAGDAVSVTRTDGSVARFVVESVELVPKNKFPSRRVYGPLGHAGLRLVTCGGTFNRQTGHYTGNVIVYAYLT
ncbi:class F sortase [Sphaerisporangium sp. NPDC049002]|uniref:class F sortase n=1 Tax=unclassified Sphaerisporangium TaxID=2630420 RepID=UPI0033D305F1